MTLRTYFPDGNLSFYSVFTDLCNDFKFIFIFVLGFGIMAADDHGMKEVVRTKLGISISAISVMTEISSSI